MPDQELAFRWTYVWLAAGGLLLALAILTFAYLLAKRRWDWMQRLLHHPALDRLDRALSNRTPRLWSFIRRRFSVHEWRGLWLTVSAVVAFAAIYLFVLISESWLEEEALYTFDQHIYQWLLASMSERMEDAMQFITRFGGGLTVTAVSVAVGVALLVKGDRWAVVSLLFSVGIGSALMHGLKWIFERQRPSDQLAQAAGHSFPSGHSFLAMTLYGFLIYLTWQKSDSDAVRIAVTAVLAAIIILVGFSRIVLRVHWASDVAGGFTVALAWLISSLILSKTLHQAYT